MTLQMGITWLDTPGLAADVSGKDDSEAKSGVEVKAEMILFVHNIQAGELDKAELDYVKKVDASFKNKPKILVLTQIDQVKSELKQQALTKIKSQIPNFKILEVSAKYYLQGIEAQGEKRNQFMELSKITNLLNEIKGNKQQILQGESLPFPCTSCGKCCKVVNRSDKTAFLDRGDGVCRYFDIRSNLCSIYENRPLVCRVEEYYKTHLSHIYSWDEFVKLNIEICNKL